MLGYPQITCKYIKDKEKLVFGLGREHNSSGNDTQGILSKGLGDRMLGFKSSCVYQKSVKDTEEENKYNGSLPFIRTFLELIVDSENRKTVLGCYMMYQLCRWCSENHTLRDYIYNLPPVQNSHSHFVDVFVKFREELKNFDPLNDASITTDDEVKMIRQEFLNKAKEYMQN